MYFRVLGLLDVSDGGRPVEVPRGKESALLALLLAHANEPIPSEELIESLWPRRRPANATKALQIHVSRLRSRLGRDRLHTTAAGYVLATGPEELDAASFVRLGAEGRSRLDAGDAAGAELLLSKALELWRGEAFADFRFDDFAQSDIRRLESVRRDAAADRAEARLALGRPEAVVAELETLVREQPLWERPRRLLMLALYQTGRQAEALELYRTTRQMLADDLGLDPSADLQELERAILNQAPELARQSPATPPRAREQGDVELSALFVGREAEMRALSSALDQALAGRGRLVLVGGEPGIGKSRLADELAAEARSRGLEVLFGRCWEAGGAPPFWPWAQALRSLGPKWDAERSSSDPDADRFRLFEAMSSLLRRASAAQPLVLVLDDLQAADAPSLLLLRFVAEEIGRMHLLVVGCYRTIDPALEDPLATTLVELGRRPETAVIELTGLPELDVTRFVELAAGPALQERTAREIARATEGNPLYVVEVVRLLAEQPRESMLDPSWRLAVPESVHAVIRLRLRHLSEDAKHLLALASVLGREFDLDALERVSTAGGDELLALLDEAAAQRIVADVPGAPGRVRFSHALIRQTLYDDLPPGRRLQLHRRVGDALEALYAANLEPHLAELAYHFFESTRPQDAARALDYAERAAGRALQLLAYEEAARHYATALSALGIVEKPEPEVRGRLLLGLGDAQQRAGESAQAKETFLLAAEAARRNDQAEQLAAAALGYGGRYVWAREGHDPDLVPLLEEALSRLDREDSAERARLLARLAGALRDESSPDRRAALSEEAVATARRVGDPATLAFALSGHLFAALASEAPERRLAVADELLAIASEAGDSERAFEAHDQRSAALMEIGDIEEVVRTDAQMATLAGKLRQPAQLWLLTANRALRALLEGRFIEAETLVQDALELGTRAQPREARFTFLLQLAALRKAQGRLAEIEPEIEGSVSEYPSRAVFPCLLVDFRCQVGRAEDARDLLSRIEIEALPVNEEWLYALHFLCEACATLRDAERAGALYELLVAHARSTASLWADGNAGSVRRYLGLLSATGSRFEEAGAHYEAAVTMNRRLGARPWLAHTQADYGRMLLARGEPEGGGKARALLDAALATYSELGMPSFAAELRPRAQPLDA